MNNLKQTLSLLFLSLFWLGLSTATYAQTRTLTGSVNDAKTAERLIGATVQVKGTTKGGITDVNGKFNISLGALDDTLLISYIGYQPKVLIVKNLSSVTVSLEPLAAMISEFVVIGYGTQKKSDLTGAVVVVETKDIARANASSFDKAIQGKAAGVMVTSNSGQPGSGASIRIRGIGSISRGSDPLIVIDGLITDNNALNSINPSDIESLQVLKDASSASIYGAQGANGVILVTTKKGEKGKTKVSFSNYFGLSTVPGYYDIMNGRQYATLMDSAWAIAVRDNPTQSDAFKKIYDAYLADPNSTSVNMPELLTQTGTKQDYTLSASGGGENSRFAISGNYYNEKGILINTYFKRYSIRMNSEFEVNKHWKVGETFVFARTEGRNEAKGGLWNSALVTSPLMHLYEPANLGGFGGPDQTITGANDKSNPFAEQNLISNTYKTNSVIGSVYTEIEFMKGLTYRFSLGYDYGSTYGNYWAPAYFLGPYGNRNNPTSTLTERNDLSQSFLINNVVNYSTSINNNHNINLMAGQEAMSSTWQYTTATGSNFANDAVNVMSQAQTINAAGGETYDHRTLSYFARLIYDYKSKYLFTSSIRRDGSSRFGPLERIGWFPSFAAAYKINQDFLQNVEQIDMLKLRLGWGMTGNEAIGDFKYMDYIQGPRESRYVFGYDQHTVYGGTVIRSFGNEAIRWEAAQMTNVGLDVNAFGNKVQFTAEYYYKKQDNMLVQIDLPRIFGRQNPDANPWVNIGQIQNTGFEFNLIYKEMEGDITYSFNGNLTSIHNKVNALPNNTPIFGGYSITQEGRSIGSFYGYIADGIFQSKEEVANSPTQIGNPQPGDIRFRDLNSDGMINDIDRTIIGKPIPDYIYGLNFDLGYKNFDFSIFLQGAQGLEIYNAFRTNVGLGTDNSGHDNNRLSNVSDYWSATNPTNSQTRLSINDAANNSRSSSFFIENGSYLRIKNIQLGYSFPAQWTNSIGVKRIRVYVSASNLLTLTKYSGLDPEIPSYNPLEANVDYGSYPVPKSYLAGVNIDF